MKKLCLTFVGLALVAFLWQGEAFGATKKHKKSSKKSHKVTQAAPAPPPPAAAAPQTVQRNHGIPRDKLEYAYAYGKNLYVANQFDKAKEVFKKIALAATDMDLSTNSLYLYSQCAFRSEDFNGCVKGLTILAKRWPQSPMIRGGYVTKFCTYVINEVANLQTRWDYFRFEEREDDKGQPVWKESVPPGIKIKRINFKLGFGLYRVLNIIQSQNAPQNVWAKKKLDYMLGAPITMLWVDEKAPPTRYGHPADFFSIFSTVEKKDFSKVICDRMFFDWETEKFYLFLVMYDDVRNLTPRYVARTKTLDDADANLVNASAPPPAPPGSSAPAAPTGDPTVVLTLSKLFQASGYNPYSDSFTSTIESSPSDMSL